jgi:hypothetical protein
VAYARFNPEKVQAAIPEQVVALWENLERNWADPAAHALFVEEGLRRDAAGFVAASYRQKGDDPIAKSQLETLAARLMKSLEIQASAMPPGTASMKRVVYVLLFFIIALLAFLIFAQYIK